MKGIRTYIQAIEPQLLSQLSGKIGELVDLVKTQSFASEEALIAHFCQDKHPRKYYHNLKSRTLKMLQALAIVSHAKGASQVKKKLDECRKNFTLGQKFLGKGERYEGLRLIRQAHRVAVTHDFVHLACECASVLYHHHIYYHRQSTKAAHYAQQVTHYADAYKVEKQAEHLFYQAIDALHRHQPLPRLRTLNREAHALPDTSLTTRTYQAMIQVSTAFRAAAYPQVIAHCQRILSVLGDHPGVYASHFHVFYMHLSLSQIALGQYEAAEHSLNRCDAYAHPRTVSDYILRLYRTINALHAGHYATAYTLYRENRKCRFEPIRQQFAIIEAYLYFLSHRGYVVLEGPFRLGKYLNETFKAQADKQGSNISILIAELLVLLVRNRSQFIDRVEAINHYSYRHLGSPETQRAKRLLKILCLLPRAQFNPVALRRLAARPIAYLEHHPLTVGDNVVIEILPFHLLLSMIFDHLQRQVA